MSSELTHRAAKAADALNEVWKKLAALLATPDTAKLEPLRDLILLSASSGIAGAVPLSAAGDSPADREVLLVQARSIQKELAQRSSQLAALTGTDARSAAIAPLHNCRRLARSSWCCRVSPRLMLPNFSKPSPTAQKCRMAIRLPPITWFQRMARVRDGGPDSTPR